MDNDGNELDDEPSSIMDAAPPPKIDDSISLPTSEDACIDSPILVERDDKEMARMIAKERLHSLNHISYDGNDKPASSISENEKMLHGSEYHNGALAASGRASMKGVTQTRLSTKTLRDSYTKQLETPTMDDLSVSGLVSMSSTAIEAADLPDLFRQENLPSPALNPGAERVSAATRGLPGGDSESFGMPDDASSTIVNDAEMDEELLVAVPITDSHLVDENRSAAERNPVTVAEVIPVDSLIKRNRRTRIGLVMVIVVLAAIVLGLVLGLARNGGKNEIAPTSAPTSSILERETLLALIQIASPSTNFSDPQSFQSRALEWMTSTENILGGVPNDRLTQIFALTTLYYSTNGTNAWDNGNTWLDLTNECLWGDGNIVCQPTESSDASIRQLDLSEGGLEGYLPPELGLLTQLTKLILNSNDLTGTLPTEVGLLTQLKQLHLHNNDLTGIIPTEFGVLENLVDLVLYNNDLSGGLPSELGSLTSLTWVSVRDNQLMGSLPSTMGRWTEIIKMFLYDNFFSGSIPSEIGLLTQMTELSIRDNQLSGSLPTELGNLLQMQELVLYLNRLAGPIPSEIGLLTDLIVFSVRNNDLTGSLPSEMGNLNQTQRLWLYDNQFTGKLPSELGALTQLTRLWLYDNEITGIMPTSLCLPENVPRIDCGEIKCTCCTNASSVACVS